MVRFFRFARSIMDIGDVLSAFNFYAKLFLVPTFQNGNVRICARGYFIEAITRIPEAYFLFFITRYKIDSFFNNDLNGVKNV